MLYREYNPDTDRQAIHAVFREIGWLKTEREEHVDYGMEAGPAVVADIDGRAEGIGTAAPGLMRYLHEDLDCWGVTAIATSPVARKQGLGLHLAARITAIAAEQGALLAALGMFEQGFYNRAGYGTMGYLHHVFFDPATLKTRVEPRVPRRLTPDDWEMIHAAQLKRMRSHGGFELLPATLTRAQLLEHEKSLGLGYCDGPNGEMTHGLWLNFDNAEYGPYYVHWLVYQNWDQFHELMALLRSLGDQVRLMHMFEPPTIQMQDLISQPFRRRSISKGSQFETGIRALAPWQVRICNLEGCLAQTHLRGEPVRFNLNLSDPIEALLDEGVSSWRGVAGRYVVTLGPESHAEKGADPALPTLTAPVGAFTRVWLGVRPASGLAVTDDVTAPPDLLARLDEILCLPEPKADLDF